MRLHYFLRVALTLLLALGAAALCVRLRTPLPWMIGPLVATAIVTMAGAPSESWGPLRNTGQWIIGAALGLYFTPQVTALVVSLWWAIALAIVWALAAGRRLWRVAALAARAATAGGRARGPCGPRPGLPAPLARRPK